jgi:DNA-binding response OmpR family regulator
MAAQDLTDLDFTRTEQAIAAAPGGSMISVARPAAPRATAPDAPVLVVDDDADIRRLLEKALTLHGFAVRMAGDAQQFVQALRQGPLPRLILLDIELPKISGFRLLSLLRKDARTSAIPVVMVTARSDNKDLVQGLALGADGYLSKPFTIESLRLVVSKVLRLAWKP